MKKAPVALPPPYLTGTNRNDTLVGTNAAEEATGLAGNDTITLFAGADRYGVTS